MKAWTRWQDWVAVVVGLYALLSFLWTPHTTTTMYTTIVLGGLIAIDGLLNLARPGMFQMEGVDVILGILLFIAPWVMGYTAMTAHSWTSWIAGGVAIVVGAWALLISRSIHHRHTTATATH
jgi:hypothetical protein